MRANSGNRRGAYAGFSKSCQYQWELWTCLVEHAAIVGRKAVGVEKETFFYYSIDAALAFRSLCQILS